MTNPIEQFDARLAAVLDTRKKIAAEVDDLLGAAKAHIAEHQAEIEATKQRIAQLATETETQFEQTATKVFTAEKKAESWVSKHWHRVAVWLGVAVIAYVSWRIVTGG